SQSLVTAFTPVGEAKPLAPAIIIAVTLSGIMPFGIGSAFWGIVAGLAIHALDGVRRPSRSARQSGLSSIATAGR
ncbi:MAG: benzoate/H(+) symporter BenE family transporter, partial [Micropruina sp.]